MLSLRSAEPLPPRRARIPASCCRRSASGSGLRHAYICWFACKRSPSLRSQIRRGRSISNSRDVCVVVFTASASLSNHHGSGGEKNRRRQPVALQHRKCLSVIVLIAVVEGQRHDRLRRTTL